MTGFSLHMPRDGARNQLAVVGRPIDHSLSPLLHTTALGELGLSQTWAYGRIDCGEEEFPEMLASLDDSWRGLSVTMPCKFAALSCATEVSARAALVGAANTLVRRDDGWFADNTDCDGVVGAVTQLVDAGRLQGAAAVIVGAGGTARPALWALGQLGVRAVTLINRSDKLAALRPLAESLGVELQWRASGEDPAVVAEYSRQAAVVISTIPAKAASAFAAYDLHAPLLDVIYDPWPTALALAARRGGQPVVGGKTMLIEQAFAQVEHFTGRSAPEEAMRRVLQSR